VVAGAPLYLCVGLIGAAGLIGRQAEESTQKRYIMQLFGRYVSPTVVQELIRNRDLVRLGGRKERLTVFFSDIRGFTSMSEKMPPEEVSALLNDYFSRMTRIVFAHGGTLDKFMGDAVMAFFGNPLYFPGHAKEAVAMALDMKEEMERLLKEREAAGQEASFGIGMGINTGEVVVGNLGSNEFVDYTVIGDDVNLACRLESVAGKGQILISASTYEEIKNDFEVVRLEPVTVKGKSRPVDVYEVLRRRVRKA
jgi:adenylate cyclase